MILQQWEGAMVPQLREAVGVEMALGQVDSFLRDHAKQLGTAVVGAHLITCSDESERRCAESFHRSFVSLLLPKAASGWRAAFRSANLGGRYERGSIQVAEEHYATPEAAGASKLMVLKIHAHVGVVETADGPRFGQLDRFGRLSACCGALAAMMNGSDLPSLREIRDLFTSGGVDRVRMLNDPQTVPPGQRALVAAITNASLQAREAVADIRRSRPRTPSLYLVLPCVTLNRSNGDTEILLGRHAIDWTMSEPQTRYEGLGDDPSAFQIDRRAGRLRVRNRETTG